MYKLLFVFVAVLCWNRDVCEANGAVEANPEYHDVGAVWQGEPIKLQIQLFNKSNHSVTFGQPVVDCPSCITLQLPQNTLDPGKRMTASAEITVNKPGKFKHRVAIPSTTPGIEPILLTVTGEIKKTYYLMSRWNSRAPDKPKHNKEKEQIEVGGFGLQNLPDLKEGDTDALEITIMGVRENDPFSKESSIQIKSNVFEKAAVTNEEIANGRLHARLLLTFKDKMTPGIYQDSLQIKIGNTVNLDVPVSFRVLGPVWPETSTISFGVIRTAPVTKTVTVNFDKGVAVWDHIRILDVTPEVYAESVELSIVESTDGKTRLAITNDPNAIDISKIQSQDDGFFYFIITLGPKEEDAGNRDTIKNKTIKLHLYGILLRED